MRHLSLFAGSGIGSLAAQAAGIVTVAHAENDPACCYCLERLWPDARLFRDVRDVTAESVADLGPIDIISGGFPCQDVSTAGKGEGLGTEENPTRSGLWYEFARVIREVRPTWCLIENVPALRVRGGDRVTNDLEAMAYEWEAVVVGAWAVGAPHKRDRVWIVARRQGDGRGQRRTRGSDTGDERQRELTLQDELADAPRSRQPQHRDERICDGEPSGAGRPRASPAGERLDGEPVHGTELGHPASDDQRRAPVAAMHREGEPVGGSSGGCGELADSDSPRLPQSVCERSDPREEQPAAIGSRWTGGESPIRQDDLRVRPPVDSDDGERLPLEDGLPGVQWDQVGNSDISTRWPSRPGEPQHPWEAPRLVEFGVGDATDGIPRRVRSRANKAALRMVGNAWCYPVAEMMFRAIMELDRQQK